MNKKKWNRNDWQGRSQRQVESNYKATDMLLQASAFLLIVFAVVRIIENTLM